MSRPTRRRHPAKRRGNGRRDASDLMSKLLGRVDSALVAAKSKPSIVTLEEALEYFAGEGAIGRPPGTPNYLGFLEWLERIDKPHPLKEIIIPLIHKSGTPSAEAVLEPIAICELRDKVNRELNMASEAGEPLAMEFIFKKKKLLTCLFHENQRLADLAAAMPFLKAGATFKDDDWDGLKQAELRLLFLISLERQELRIATLALGRLQRKGHDDGEVSYFYALLHFELGEFEKCIEYAEKLSPDHVDYKQALAINLQALAYLGRVGSLLNRLEQQRPDQIPPFFFLHLLQITMVNSEDPRGDAERFVSSPLFGILTKEGLDYERDIFGNVFNHFNCRLAASFVEALNAWELSEKLGLGSDAELDTDIDEQDVAHPAIQNFFHNENLPLEHQRLVQALVVDIKFLLTLVYEDSEKRYEHIRARLLTSMYGASPEDIELALSMESRIAPKQVFVSDFMELSANLVEMESGEKSPGLSGQWPALWAEAWVQASVLGSSKTLDFLEKNGEFFGHRVAARALHLKVEEEILCGWLSPIGAQSYRWACESLDVARSGKDRGIVDAGMVSLGFFRIIEVELNKRIIKPLLGDVVWFERLHAALENLEQGHKKEDITNNEKKRRDDSIKLWNSLVKNIKDIVSGGRAGLELGSLRIFLGKIRHPAGFDEVIARVARTRIEPYLTPEGLAALEGKKMESIIEQAVLDRYRNPPAHTRFVGFEVATECKSYVENVLADMRGWFVT